MRSGIPGNLLIRVEKMLYYTLFGLEPRGASDHKKDFKNEKNSKFAIGVVYHFSFWDDLGEKLWLAKSYKLDCWIQLERFLIVFNCYLLRLTTVYCRYNSKLPRTLYFLRQALYKLLFIITFDSDRFREKTAA